MWFLYLEVLISTPDTFRAIPETDAGLSLHNHVYPAGFIQGIGKITVYLRGIIILYLTVNDAWWESGCPVDAEEQLKYRSGEAG